MEVISARAGFETAFPGDSHAWKMHSFLQAAAPAATRHPRSAARIRAPAGAARGRVQLQLGPRPVAERVVPRGGAWASQVQNKLQLEAVTNLVSVGDSHIEMDAVHLLGRSFAHALVKTVKLWERPTPYELASSAASPRPSTDQSTPRAAPAMPAFARVAPPPRPRGAAGTACVRGCVAWADQAARGRQGEAPRDLPVGHDAQHMAAAPRHKWPPPGRGERTADMRREGCQRPCRRAQVGAREHRAGLTAYAAYRAPLLLE